MLYFGIRSTTILFIEDHSIRYGNILNRKLYFSDEIKGYELKRYVESDKLEKAQERWELKIIKNKKKYIKIKDTFWEEDFKKIQQRIHQQYQQLKPLDKKTIRQKEASALHHKISLGIGVFALLVGLILFAISYAKATHDYAPALLLIIIGSSLSTYHYYLK